MLEECGTGECYELNMVKEMRGLQYPSLPGKNHRSSLTADNETGIEYHIA